MSQEQRKAVEVELTIPNLMVAPMVAPNCNVQRQDFREVRLVSLYVSATPNLRTEVVKY